MANESGRKVKFSPGMLVQTSDGRLAQVLGTRNGNVIVGTSPRNFGVDTVHKTVALYPPEHLNIIGEWKRPE